MKPAPAPSRVLSSAPLLAAAALGCVTLVWTVQAGPAQASHFFLAPLTTASALCSWRHPQSRRARPTLLASLLLSLLVHLAHFVAQPVSWVGALAAANAVVILILSEKHFCRWRQSPPSKSSASFIRTVAKPTTAPAPTSSFALALLLPEPRAIDVSGLREVAERAFGPDEVHEATDQGGGAFQLTGSFGGLRLLALPSPYWPNPGKAGASVSDPDLHLAIVSHQAFLCAAALDIAPGSQPKTRPEAAVIRLIVELAEPETLAIFDPQTGQVSLWNDDVFMRFLRPGSSPHFSACSVPAEFRIDRSQATRSHFLRPALARFPEFKEAFSRRRSGEHFTVKALVTDGGRTECIWILVDALHQETVEGRLANHPVSLPSLRYGSLVAVRISDIQDWAYPSGSG